MFILFHDYIINIENIRAIRRSVQNDIFLIEIGLDNDGVLVSDYYTEAERNQDFEKLYTDLTGQDI